MHFDALLIFLIFLSLWVGSWVPARDCLQYQGGSSQGWPRLPTEKALKRQCVKMCQGIIISAAGHRHFAAQRRCHMEHGSYGQGMSNVKAFRAPCHQVFAFRSHGLEDLQRGSCKREVSRPWHISHTTRDIPYPITMCTICALYHRTIILFDRFWGVSIVSVPASLHHSRSGQHHGWLCP